MSDLPPMDGTPTKFVFSKEKTEEVKPEKRTVNKVHLREEGKQEGDKKKFICSGLDPDCDFDTDFKSAYANHIKKHKPDMLELYGGELVQIWQPFGHGELIWDPEKSIYVSPNQISMPDGFELYKLTGKIMSKTVPTRTHDGGIRSMDFMEVIIRRIMK